VDEASSLPHGDARRAEILDLLGAKWIDRDPPNNSPERVAEARRLRAANAAVAGLVCERRTRLAIRPRPRRSHTAQRRRSVVRRGAASRDGPDSGEAEAGVTVQPSLAGGRAFDFEFVDERAEGELEGAREALERAKQAEAAFRAEHMAELAAERLEGARAVGRRLVEAASALSAALNEWQREQRELARLGVPQEDVPPSPFADASAADGIRHVDRALREDPDALVPSPRWVTGARRGTPSRV
jgi:hypothetical protein